MVNSGLKLPESPNTAGHTYIVSTPRDQGRWKERVRTDEAVVATSHYPRHGHFDSPEEDIEAVRKHHCTTSRRASALRAHRKRNSSEHVQGVDSPPFRSKISPCRFVICSGAFEISLQVASAAASTIRGGKRRDR